MTIMDEPPAQRLARYVRTRRTDLGLTQKQAAARAGISEPTWRVLERGTQERFEPLTVAGVCRALDWTPDAFDQILTGAAPQPDQDPPPAGPAAANPFRRADSTMALAALTDKIGRLSGTQRYAVERIVDELLGEDR